MRQLSTFILTLALAVLLAMPASASEYADMDICLGKQLIARLLCKDPSEVNFVTKVQEHVNLFSVFYAKTEARFFVSVGKDFIRLQGKDFKTITRTIPYHFDSMAKCGVVDFTISDCPNTERIVCCSEKTVEEKLDEKFWDRPIPELLEEDLRKALEIDSGEKEEDGDGKPKPKKPGPGGLPPAPKK